MKIIIGNLFTSILNLFGSKEVRILILGLDGAGKTTILYQLQCGEVVTTVPSKSFFLLLLRKNVKKIKKKKAIGFNVENVTYKNVLFKGKLITNEILLYFFKEELSN